MRFAALRRLGLRKTAVGLAPFMRFFSATFFCARKKCFAFFLIGRKKTSHTAGTLCEMGAKLIIIFFKIVH
jgi:hypothetical protein